MAWNWLDRKKNETGEWTGFLEQGVRLDGTLHVEGTFRINSTAKGKIVSRDTLILGERAVVEGEIVGNSVVIAGRFAGKISAQARVEIQANAVVTGDIQTPCLIVDSGGVFDGQCLMPTTSDQTGPISIPIRPVPITTGVST